MHPLTSNKNIFTTYIYWIIDLNDNKITYTFVRLPVLICILINKVNYRNSLVYRTPIWFNKSSANALPISKLVNISLHKYHEIDQYVLIQKYCNIPNQNRKIFIKYNCETLKSSVIIRIHNHYHLTSLATSTTRSWSLFSASLS